MVQDKSGQLQQKQNKPPKQDGMKQQHPEKKLPPKPRPCQLANSEPPNVVCKQREAVSLTPNFEQYLDIKITVRQKKVDKGGKQQDAQKKTVPRSLRNYKQQQGCIKLTLEKFRALALNPSSPTIFYSEPIQLAGFYWKLCAERSVDNQIGLHLCIYVPRSCPIDWECRVNFTFCVKHISDADACIHRSNGKPVIFSNVLGRHGRSGFADMVGIYHLLDPQSGFVDLQDCVKMGVSFTVLFSTQG